MTARYRFHYVLAFLLIIWFVAGLTALPARADSIVITPNITTATTTLGNPAQCSSLGLFPCSVPVVIDYTVVVDNNMGLVIQVFRDLVTPAGFNATFLSDTCSGQIFPATTTTCTASVSWSLSINPANVGNLPVAIPVQLFYFSTGPSVPVTAGTTTITILQSVPEPSGLLLLGTGLLGLVGAAGKKWRNRL